MIPFKAEKKGQRNKQTKNPEGTNKKQITKWQI